ncbi:MAG TPA: cytochrome C oxidase subunit IV family protein [Acidiferrobacteraceae bacterium]|nr:cytochrome C oxidase subunit IV family protein [Acidiferrobacteraceae bacterium]
MADLGCRRELRDYVWGLGSALALTALAFWVVARSHLGSAQQMIAISSCAVLQLLAQFRFFLHLDLRRSHRDDLHLVLFSGLIIALMVGGTLWIAYSQYRRMM